MGGKLAQVSGEVKRALSESRLWCRPRSAGAAQPPIAEPGTRDGHVDCSFCCAALHVHRRKARKYWHRLLVRV